MKSARALAKIRALAVEEHETGWCNSLGLYGSMSDMAIYRRQSFTFSPRHCQLLVGEW
jgi:hypothetical protein